MIRLARRARDAKGLSIVAALVFSLPAHADSDHSRFPIAAIRSTSHAVLLALAALSLSTAVALAATPANPRFAIASSPVFNEVVVNWEPVAPSSGYTDAQVGYRIYRATASGGPYTLIAQQMGRWNISYIDTSVEHLTRYWYRIASGCQSSSPGEWNATPVYMTGTPSGITAEALMSPTTGGPAEPRNLAATATVTGNSVDKITVTWDRVGGANVIGYEVWRLSESGTTGVLLGTAPAGANPFFEDTSGLMVETHYWYRVAAIAQKGATTRTGPKSFEFHIRPMSNEEMAVPHGGGSPDGESCMRCHDTHAATSAPLLRMDYECSEEFCLFCHNGTGSRYDIQADYEDAGAGSKHPVETDGSGDLTCTDCHTPHGDPEAEGSYKLLRAYGISEGIEYCLVCHKPDTPDDGTYTERTRDMTAFRTSAHNAEGVADPPSGTGIKCRTCHLPHTAPNEDLLMYTGYRACFNCHSHASGGSLTSPDIYALMTANDDLDAHHDVLARDQSQSLSGRMACQNCHNSHSATSARPLIDPYDPAPWNAYPQTSRFAVTDHWQNSFCFECHDNSLPTAADTNPWVDPPVWSDPANNGNATSDFDNITSRWGSQNHGKRTTSGEIVWPEVVAALGANPELLCLDCHEPHGTLGVRNLRSDIFTEHGLLIVERGDIISGATGYDSRFWCLGCHVPPTNHTSGSKNFSTFPRDCSNGGSCHGHQNGGGQF